MQELDCNCPKCNAENSLTVTATSAAHNPKLLDIIVQCAECDHTLNAFVDIAEMQVVE
jgi:C4-type Zn-finger protein